MLLPDGIFMARPTGSCCIKSSQYCLLQVAGLCLSLSFPLAGFSCFSPLLCRFLAWTHWARDKEKVPWTLSNSIPLRSSLGIGSAWQTRFVSNSLCTRLSHTKCTVCPPSYAKRAKPSQSWSPPTSARQVHSGRASHRTRKHQKDDSCMLIYLPCPP